MADKKTTKTETTVRKKTPCPVSREEFAKAAKPLTLTIEGQTFVLSPKEFAGQSGQPDGTGSLGWFMNDKLTLKIGDTPVRVQPTISLVLIGSKVEKS